MKTAGTFDNKLILLEPTSNLTSTTTGSAVDLNGDDMAAHKRTIQFFFDNDLNKRTKTGRMVNDSFKYDDQARAG